MTDHNPTEVPLWERQPWDTPTSYARFREFYLYQKPPRSLNSAYQAYRAKKTGAQGVAKGLVANGTWQNWYRGNDSSGQPIPGAVGWQRRAHAWDDYKRDEALKAEIREAEEMRRDVKTLLRGAFLKLARSINNLNTDNLTPNQLARFMALTLEHTMSFYAIQPIDLSQAGSPTALEEWKQKRLDQLRLLNQEFEEASEDGDLSEEDLPDLDQILSLLDQGLSETSSEEE